MTGSPRENGESQSIFNMKIFEKIENKRDLKKLFSPLESDCYGLFGQLESSSNSKNVQIPKVTR